MQTSIVPRAAQSRERSIVKLDYHVFKSMANGYLGLYVDRARRPTFFDVEQTWTAQSVPSEISSAACRNTNAAPPSKIASRKNSPAMVPSSPNRWQSLCLPRAVNVIPLARVCTEETTGDHSSRPPE